MDQTSMRGRRTIALLAALAVAGVVPGAAAPAQAAGTFTFYGSGYGHGLGLSQWGAEGLAEMGWGFRRILTHFYRGTRVEPDPNPPAKIRIGLTEDRAVVHLTAKAGRVSIWAGGPAHGTLVGEIAGGDTWTVAAKDGSYAVKDQTGALVGGQRWGSPTEDLILTYADVGARVLIPEADAIYHRGFSYARGTIELNLYRCGGDGPCVERLIARLGFEEYLYGLGEVPSSWPMATLQTQAIAARTYARYAMRTHGLRPWCNCHLSDGSGDQTYVGWSKESGDQGARWVRAVDTTTTLIVTYRGDVIQTFYSASDGGHTENVEDAWHGGDPAFAIPWLTGVCDPGEWASGNDWLSWSRSFDASTLTSRLARYTGSIGTVTRFSGAERGASGRIVSIVVRGTSGSASIRGIDLRSGLALPDDRVWINSDRSILGGIRQAYDAHGCAPGLPSSPRLAVDGGAQQFFQRGGIYRNAPADVTVWLTGALDGEYRDVGAAAGVLGVPRTHVQQLGGRALSCTRCSRVDFVGGRIYWKSGVGAHALWGDVLATYLDAGGAGGALGFPITRVRHTAEGGTKARFEHGEIVCGAGGCTVTTG
jgi:SpoIID/LytB domain protein